MAISFDKAFGVHQYTLSVRAKRAEVLSSNIANADTPGFKARDINFSQALQDAQGQQGFGLSTTSEKHFALQMDSPGTTQYRNPCNRIPVTATRWTYSRSAASSCATALNTRPLLNS